MPRPKKTKTALAVLPKASTAIDPLDVPGGDEADDFIEYLFTASDIGRDQATLNALGRAGNQAASIFDGLQEWARKEGMAIAATAIRELLRRRPGLMLMERQQISHRAQLTRGTEAELSLQPFFNTREEANALRKVLPVSYTRRWRAYYESWGCVVCGDREAPHDSCGMCARCRGRITARMRQAVWMANPDARACPPLEEDDTGTPALPSGTDLPKARRCKACGKRFKPMSDRAWATCRLEHEQTLRHRDAVKARRKGGNR